jgi:hypothetical protein
VGLGLLAATGAGAQSLSPLALSAATTAILVIVAAWEKASFMRGPALRP